MLGRGGVKAEVDEDVGFHGRRGEVRGHRDAQAADPGQGPEVRTLVRALRVVHGAGQDDIGWRLFVQTAGNSASHSTGGADDNDACHA